MRERASQIEVNETEGDGHINEPSRAGALHKHLSKQ